MSDKIKFCTRCEKRKPLDEFIGNRWCTSCNSEQRFEWRLGFCINCGAEVYNVEPDARNYICEDCGKDEVFGAEELLIMYA